MPAMLQGATATGRGTEINPFSLFLLLQKRDAGQINLFCNICKVLQRAALNFDLDKGRLAGADDLSIRYACNILLNPCRKS